MASPIDLARQVAGFDDDAVDHLKTLLRSWGLLADLALGDVLLLAPTNNAESFVVIANVRPSTGSTLYTPDPIGDRHHRENRPLVGAAWDTGKVQKPSSSSAHTFRRVRRKFSPHRLVSMVDALALCFANVGIWNESSYSLRKPTWSSRTA